MIKISCLQLLMFLTLLPQFGVALTCKEVFAPAQAGIYGNYSLASTNFYRRIKVENIDQYAIDEYGSKSWDGKNPSADAKAQELVQKLRGLGNGFEVLIVDPGLLQRIDQFIQFMAGKNINDPWIARDEFGLRGVQQVKVFRGLALTEAEYSEILKKGFIASPIRELSKSGSKGNARENFIRFLLNVSRRLHLDFHERWGWTDSPFISVTSYPELASAMALKFKDRYEKRAYLFEITISELDIIALDIQNGIWRPGEMLAGNPNSVVELYSRDGTLKRIPAGRDVESFVFQMIPVRNIRSIPLVEGATYQIRH